MTKKELSLIGAIHSSVTCHSPNMWVSFSNTGLSFWFLLKTSKPQSIIMADCLKFLAACFETNTWLSFFGHRETLRNFKRCSVKNIHTRLHISNETWNLYADLHISSFYLETFHSVHFLAVFLYFFFQI